MRITVPPAVKKGDNANLICNYDMEGDTLYTVKYYKGRREFYRYTPKENPAIKVFPHPGIRIEVSALSASLDLFTRVDRGRMARDVDEDAKAHDGAFYYCPPTDRPETTINKFLQSSGRAKGIDNVPRQEDEGLCWARE